VSRRAAEGKAGALRSHILDAAARRVNKFLGHALITLAHARADFYNGAREKLMTAAMPFATSC
jgi:hypothetical protein